MVIADLPSTDETLAAIELADCMALAVQTALLDNASVRQLPVQAVARVGRLEGLFDFGSRVACSWSTSRPYGCAARQ